MKTHWAIAKTLIIVVVM